MIGVQFLLRPLFTNLRDNVLMVKKIKQRKLNYLDRWYGKYNMNCHISVKTLIKVLSKNLFPLGV
jgi:hypothetical protein